MNCLADAKVCDRCNKKIKCFTKTKDWSGRRYHMTCYRQKMADIAYDELMKETHERIQKELAAKGAITITGGHRT